MPIRSFPPHHLATPEGVLALGGDLEVSTLKLAYENGIFPWPHEGYPLLWFSLPKRAILEFSDLKIPSRLARELRSKHFSHAIDQNFPAVIQACAEGRTRSSSGTWIIPEMIHAYIQFYRAGFAHSFETYDVSGNLVGGMYGISMGSMFVGESMFFLEPSASKSALLFAVDFLKSRGLTWMDIQTMSPLLQKLGAKEVPRAQFLEKLKSSLKKPNIFK